jgi:hypothetical protein
LPPTVPYGVTALVPGSHAVVDLGYSPDRHASRYLYLAHKLLEALGRRDHVGATHRANELVNAANEGRAARSFVQELLAAAAAARDAVPETVSAHASGSVDRVAEALHAWCIAVDQRDGTAAARGNELLERVVEAGLSPEGSDRHMRPNDAQGLMGAMQRVIRVTHEAAIAPGSDDKDGDKGSADAVDWKDPSTERFYVFDKRSGAELARVLYHLQGAEVCREWGARPPNRLLFVGPPGTGKTAGALRLGADLGKTVGLIRLDGVKGSADGKTSKNLRACAEACVERDAIILIDELEGVTVSRADSSPNTPEWYKQVTQALLQLLDWLTEEHPSIIFIGCTNVPSAIDSAIQRRMRRHVTFHVPDRDARAGMLKQWWAKAPHEGEAKKRLLDFTGPTTAAPLGLSGDHLQRMAEEAILLAAPRGRGNGNKVGLKDVETAVRTVLGLRPEESLPDVLPGEMNDDEMSDASAPSV